MRSVGYGLSTQYRWEQGKVTRDRIIEKCTFYPNSKQGACAPVVPHDPAALSS